MHPLSPQPTLFPYTTLFRSQEKQLSHLYKGTLGGENRYRFQTAEIEPACKGRGIPVQFLIACRLDGVEQRGDGLSEQVERSEEQRLNSSHTVISYAVFCLKK